MMKVATLSSSSKGNSTLIMGDNTNILIDAGINIKNLIEKLALFNIEPSQIDGILVTHEHGDHIKSVGGFAKKYGCMVYCYGVGKGGILPKLKNLPQQQISHFGNQPFSVGEFVVKGFDVPHDSQTCVGFVVDNGFDKVGYATDLGYVDERILSNLANCKVVMLESNHCEQMLRNNPNYSAMLKARILGKYGHLSNINCAKAIEYLAQNGVKQVVLSHLSLDNNTPELCYSTVTKYLKSVGIECGLHIKIDVAPPFNLGTVFVLKQR